MKNDRDPVTFILWSLIFLLICLVAMVVYRGKDFDYYTIIVHRTGQPETIYKHVKLSYQEVNDAMREHSIKLNDQGIIIIGDFDLLKEGK